MIYAIYNRETGALLDLSESIKDVDLPIVCEPIATPDLAKEVWSVTMRLFTPRVSTVRRITKQDLIDRMLPEEMAGILTAAKTDVMAEAWLFRFNSVTPDPDGTSIDLGDPRTIAGLTAMLGATRAAEILA